MSKKNKRRICPALNKEIDSAECGANRHSQYNCPVSCAYSPYNPENYDQILELGAQLDKLILERAARHPLFGKLIEKLFRDSPKDEFVMAAKMLEILHYVVDDHGLSFFEAWRVEGYKGLKNDLRVLLEHKQTMKVSLVEFQEVVDEQTVTFVDLLDDSGRIHTAVDRSLALRACRFQTMIGYYYTVPQFTHFHAFAREQPSLQGFSPLEAFNEVVNHLGGKTSQKWLLANMERVCEAFDSTLLEQRRKMLEASNIKSRELEYKMSIPLKLGVEILRKANLRESPLDRETRRDGYIYAFDQLETGSNSSGNETRVLGSIQLKQGYSRLFSINANGMEKVRETFENALGGNAELHRDIVQDLSQQLAENTPPVDRSLVAPCFLEFNNRFSASSSTMDMPQAMPNEKVATSQYLESYYKELMDQPIPALDNASPRQASTDFLLRPKLVSWVKELLFETDKSNLHKGESVDLNWMTSELGLDELNFPAPPPRPRPAIPNADEEDLDDEYEDGIDDYQIEKYTKLINRFLTEFKSADEGLIRMKAAGCNLMEVFKEETADLLFSKTNNLLDFLIPAAWYALAQEDQIIRVSAETLSWEIEELASLMEDHQDADRETLAQEFPYLCIDPELFIAISHLIEVFQEEAFKNDQLSEDEISEVIFYIIVVINVLSEYL
ncbi:MAG: hypothetical protein O7C75_02205 [Verrucomicrobia bacterium]|nr:hypothetical protein [Verrucomicrobiota bacterium]